MRSSKSRSRSKSNRNRPSGGNIVNRVFDSSGPEGKVRGTPQQIIDKYNQLTRDAQLSGDRVAAENFAQHAEHYTRMLAEAQREMDQRREQNDQQNRDRQQNTGNNDRDRQQGEQGAEREAQGNERVEADQPRSAPAEQKADDPGGQPQAEPKKRSRARKAPTPREDDVTDPRGGGEDGDSTLVETPEGKPKPRRRTRAKAASSDEAGSESEGGAAAGSESENQAVD